MCETLLSKSLDHPAHIRYFIQCYVIYSPESPKRIGISGPVLSKLGTSWDCRSVLLGVCPRRPCLTMPAQRFLSCMFTCKWPPKRKTTYMRWFYDGERFSAHAQPNAADFLHLGTLSKILLPLTVSNSKKKSSNFFGSVTSGMRQPWPKYAVLDGGAWQSVSQSEGRVFRGRRKEDDENGWLSWTQGWQITQNKDIMLTWLQC